MHLSWKTPFKASKICFYALLSMLSFLVTYELSKFYTADLKQPILEIKIKKLDHQHYQIDLTSPIKDSITSAYQIYGDMWQVDMKILAWKSIVAYLGIEALYNLERLNGRYGKLDDELNKPRSIVTLNAEKATDVAWPYLLTFLEATLVRSYYGASVYAPMANRANFAIYLTDTGIELMPVNKEAKQALKNW